MTGYLVLENGEIFEGERIGCNTDTALELVCNDESLGYIETITDPSYYGKGIVFTFPLIGNYGMIHEDFESDGVWAQAIFIQEIAEFESSFPKKENFDKYLREFKIPGLSGIDVNKIADIIRKEKTMKAYLTSTLNNIDDIMGKIKSYKIENPVQVVTSKQIRTYGRGKNKKIALFDLGFKHGIVNALLKRDTEVTIYPANTNAEVILANNPNGIVISNGPGNPEDLKYPIKTIKKLLDSNIPVLGIELGHLAIALAEDFKVEKLSEKHIGINYTVKELKRNRLYVTAQNNEYTVTEESVDKNAAEVSYKNLKDNTIAGLIYKNKNIFTIAFSPEACPGPLDTNFIFDNFIKKI